jgi:hypothetical protein
MSTKTTTSTFDAKAIEKQNKAFWKMSKKQQRVEIAKDVLLQLKAKNYLAQPGTYVRSNTLNSWEYRQGFDFQQVLVTQSPKCEVCGIGALFCSMARVGDRISFRDDFWDSLTLVFDRSQIDLIEGAFEGWGYRGEGVREFYHKYPAPNKRLAAIMRNIIKNEGKLILT